MIPDYYGHSRREIAPLLPNSVGRVLEIGCSAGGTLAWLKGKWPEAEFVGVDGNSDVLDELKVIGGGSFIHDLNQPLPDIGRFDLILALDILEHLTEPEPVLKDLVSRLTDTGQIVVSLPNVSHLSVIAGLALKREFEYSDAGILDRTHLRFFTEKSALRLMRQSGLTVTAGIVTGLEGRKAKLLNTLTGGLLLHYLAKQYIMVGGLGETSSPFTWHPAD
jgi:2-polyprenyl-3-methyl-5-hydroxy-6-metoxy-1,4-benzoquinol methylase